MAEFNFGDRLVFAEQRISVLQKDLTTNLTAFAETFNKLLQTNRAFQSYVATRLDEITGRLEELRKHAGIEWSEDTRDLTVQEEAKLAADIAADGNNAGSVTENPSQPGPDQPTNVRPEAGE